MGPFGKLTSKLKCQQKEVPKNDKRAMECKTEMDVQCLDPSSITCERAGSMAEHHSIRAAAYKVEDGNNMGKHRDTRPTMETTTRNPQIANAVNPLISSELEGAGDAKMKKCWRDGMYTLSFHRPWEAITSVRSPTARSEGKCAGESDSNLKAPVIVHKTEPICESADLDSSSLSLSLGLNRIKTRSGPLYNEVIDGEVETAGLGSNPVKGVKATASGERRDDTIDESCVRQGRLSVDMDRSRFEPMAIGGRWEGKHVENSMGPTHVDADMIMESSQQQEKTRRKSKTESSSERLQRGHSGGRRINLTAIPMIGKAFTSNFGIPSPNEKVGVSPVSAEELPKTSMKSDDNLDKKVPSSLLSYLNSEFNESFDMEASMKQLDVIKEGESPTFAQAVPPITQLRTFKKWPKDIKSFSHELGPRGGRTHDVHRPHSDNDLEELLAALRARFNTAKEEVDAELTFFAADLVEILDRNTDSFPGWKENVEDLLVLAQRCTELSPVEFRRECENIVHDLDERRQELPMGLLKRLHTRMLFILTRCTRLLQFQKETIPEEEGLHKVQQCLKGVPSVEQAMSSGPNKRGKGKTTSKKLLPEVLEQSARSDVGLPKLKPSKHLKKHKLSLDKVKLKNQRSDSAKAGRNEFNRLLSLKKLPATGCESFDVADVSLPKKSFPKESAVSTVQGASDQVEVKILDADLHTASLSSSSKHDDKLSWVNWTDYEKEELEYVICRICEEEVLTSHLEPHSLRCTLAEACDNQGVNVDERLRLLADNLERIAELSTPKSNQMVTADESLDGFRLSKLASHDGSDNASPQSNDYQGKVLDVRLDEVSASEAVGGEDTRGLSLIIFKRLLGIKADQGVTSSSAGSGTPRSALTTPRTSQLDLLWAERNSFVELEDTSQIHELAAMARDIASKNFMDEGILDSLGSYLEELHELLRRNKIADLTVDTFGKRIEKLLREKIYIYNGPVETRRFDSLSGCFEDDGMSTDEGVPSFRSTPTHPLHSDRIRIEDFDMLKLISRGAFGRVFLAKKRTTGDLFAIKVLRKSDMIRKNAVENILAERDILITVCNPFVVRFFYSFTCRDNLYLVMEYLNGGDLYSLLRHMGCLDEDVARVYIAELVLALEYLHSLGVVHRDLKPDNILIAHDGHIKLTDFGLSKVGLINSTDDLSGPANGTLLEDSMFETCGEHAMQREFRKERSAVGTPDYLAPEILLGTEHGYTADWWSVGVILFECITGLPPFNAEHPQIIFDNILNRKIPWPHVPEEMSEEAKDLIDKLLTEDPNQRLGAKGAPEVKSHHFFKDISWDNLARQKAAFVPSPESVDDTSYFTSRHTESYANSSPRFLESSDCSTRSSSSNSIRAILHEGEDECGDLADFQSSPSVERTFNNFSFKNASQLAFMNYDILSQSGRDGGKGHSRHQSAS